MNFIKRHPLFTTIIAAFVLLILGEAWYVYMLRAEVVAAEQDVRQRIAEIESLQRRKPAPVADNLRVARDDFAQNAEVLATMLRVLNVTGPDDLEFFKGEPATRPDAWFEISQFVDRMTSEARKSNVRLNADERFGFAAFTFEGPEPAYIRSVYRQHRIVEYLLGKLFAARPRALLAVQREQPLPVGETAAAPTAPRPAPLQNQGGPNTGAGEIFVIDPQVSARTPGYVDTLAFRIIFSGQTNSLRGFMNALAAPDIPLVVRSVEVTQGSTAAATSPGADSNRRPRPANPFSNTAAPAAGSDPAVSQAVVPIVPENDSVFTVTVELFDVKIRAPQVTATASLP